MPVKQSGRNIAVWVVIPLFILALLYGFLIYEKQRQPKSHSDTRATPAPVPAVTVPPAPPVKPPSPPAEAPVFHLAYSSEDGIYTVAPDGTGKKRLIDDPPGWPGDPFAISPDGKWAVYMQRGSEELDNTLVVINLAMRKQRVYADEPFGRDVTFNPDSRHIVYISYPPEGDRDASAIYSLDVTGDKPERLDAGSNHDWVSGPSFAPDGQSCAVGAMTSNDTGDADYDIWLAKITNGKATRFTRLCSGDSPSYAPDGKTIIFARDTGIFTIRTDGTGLRRLTDVETDTGADGHGHPVFSPDGKLIAYHRIWKTGKKILAEGVDEVDDIAATICVMNADGTGVKRLIKGWNPCWMPAAKKKPGK